MRSNYLFYWRSEKSVRIHSQNPCKLFNMFVPPYDAVLGQQISKMLYVML